MPMTACVAILVWVLLAIIVLVVPAVARVIGAAVLILLVAAVVAAIAEPAHAFDPTVPTCQGWWTVDRRPLPPCHPGWKRSPSSGLCVPDCKPTCMKTRIAEAQRPMPVPQIGAGCPPGYNASPTSGTCSPSSTTRCRAFPSPSGSCPNGFGYSPTSRMCVESHCP
jgi:hypothetical protein